MSKQDLIDVTGKKRPSAQVAWFQRQFGIAPVQRADGQIILTWAMFEGMQAKRAGVMPSPQSTGERPQLMPVRKRG